MITPIQGRVLVKLKGAYENLDTTDERFGTSKTRGEVAALPINTKHEGIDWQGHCSELGIEIGSTVYFGKYEDTAPYGNDQDLVLIKLEDIGGVSDGSDD